MPGYARKSYSGGGKGIGPVNAPRPASNRKRPAGTAPAFPSCPTRSPNGKKCHLNMNRDGFTKLGEDDELWARSCLSTEDSFHSLWRCEECGRIWMRYARKDSWGQRQFRWAHVWKVETDD